MSVEAIEKMIMSSMEGLGPLFGRSPAGSIVNADLNRSFSHGDGVTI